VSLRSDTAAAPPGERGDAATPPPTPERRPARGVMLAFALVLGALLVAIVVLLSQDGRRLAGSNNVFDRFTVVRLQPGKEVCDRRETVPAGTASVRLTIARATEGAPVAVRVREAGGRVAERGTIAGGWSGSRVDVPIGDVASTIANAQVCITSSQPLFLRGYNTANEGESSAVDGNPSKETIRLQYIRGGEESWWSVLPAIAKRMGVARGKVFDGVWMFVAWAGLLVLVVGAVTVAVRRGIPPAPSLRRIPRAGWTCALVALLSGSAWALVTPAFHVPDEVSHFAYAQYLAETGRLPVENGDDTYSPEEMQAIRDTQFYLVVGDVDARPPWTEAQDRAMDAEPPARSIGSGSATTATNNPPLYYGLEAVPYKVGRALGLDLLDTLMLMRFLSVLCAAVTALAAFLFVREVVPSTPWAWTAGGLAAALQPLFGFVSSGVQGDALLYTAGALLLLALARAFRRGLTAPRAAAIGAAGAIGLLTKLTFIGLIPGAALGVLLLARRDRAWRALGVAAGLAALVAVAYAVANKAIWGRPLLYGGTGVPAPAEGGAAPTLDPFAGLAYTWQLYLPRLPFMADQFPGENPMPNLWLHGFVGRFGWLDVAWPDAAYTWARWLLVAVVVMAGLELLRAARRGAMKGRWSELVTYAAVLLGLLLLIGWAGYRARVTGSFGFEQARYLLPLLPLYAAAVALAARLWGARRGPVVAAVLVGLAVSQVLLAQLLTVSRFYG
jgi:hypothetical protein